MNISINPTNYNPNFSGVRAVKTRKIALASALKKGFERHQSKYLVEEISSKSSIERTGFHEFAIFDGSEKEFLAGRYAEAKRVSEIDSDEALQQTFDIFSYINGWAREQYDKVPAKIIKSAKGVKKFIGNT